MPVLTVRPRSSSVRLGQAVPGVRHGLAAGARRLRGSVGRRRPRGERRARQRVAVPGEVAAGGAAGEAEYGPLLKDAQAIEGGGGPGPAPRRRVRDSSSSGGSGAAGAPLASTVGAGGLLVLRLGGGGGGGRRRRTPSALPAPRCRARAIGAVRWSVGGAERHRQPGLSSLGPNSPKPRVAPASGAACGRASCARTGPPRVPVVFLFCFPSRNTRFPSFLLQLTRRESRKPARTDFLVVFFPLCLLSGRASNKTAR